MFRKAIHLVRFKIALFTIDIVSLGRKRIDVCSKAFGGPGGQFGVRESGAAFCYTASKVLDVARLARLNDFLLQENCLGCATVDAY